MSTEKRGLHFCYPYPEHRTVTRSLLRFNVVKQPLTNPRKYRRIPRNYYPIGPVPAGITVLVKSLASLPIIMVFDNYKPILTSDALLICFTTETLLQLFDSSLQCIAFRHLLQSKAIYVQPELRL